MLLQVHPGKVYTYIIVYVCTHPYTSTVHWGMCVTLPVNV